MLCGSCFGAVAWVSSMQALYGHEAGRSLISNPSVAVQRQRFPMFALALQYEAVFSVTYALDFLCLSTAKLMVLDRMTEFSLRHADGIDARWVRGKRAVMVVVVFIGLVGLCGNVAAALYQVQTGLYWSKSFTALASNNTAAFEDYRNQARDWTDRSLSVASVQHICEVAVLHIILLTFAVVGATCARQVQSALLKMKFNAEGAAGVKKIRAQILAPVCVVFVAFLLRSIHATMYAVAAGLQDKDKLVSCPIPLSSERSIWCETTCFNSYTQMIAWMDRTPEFRLSIMLISSPLALIAALWGMTSDRALHLMRQAAQAKQPEKQDAVLMALVRGH